jgi:hypothetical protein
MEPPTTVIGLVTALVQTYAGGLDLYTQWKRRRAQQNHYRRQRGNAVPTCALSTSLGVSGPQIKETYDIAFAIVGSEFSTGDGEPTQPNPTRPSQTQRPIPFPSPAILR